MPPALIKRIRISQIEIIGLLLTIDLCQTPARHRPALRDSGEAGGHGMMEYWGKAPNLKLSLSYANH